MRIKIAFVQLLPGIDLDRLRTHRSNDIMGDKYRHPEKYVILSNPDVRDVIGGEFVHW